MTHDRWQERISNYMDDKLEPSECEAIESHLASCEECRATLDDYRAIRGWASNFAAPPPSTDPWDSIAPQLQALGSRPRAFRVRLAWAASIALVLVAGGAYGLGLLEGPTPVPDDQARGASDPVTSVGISTLDDTSYAGRIRTLEQVLVEAKSRMDPATVETVEESLRAIDEALDRAAAALAADPTNKLLRALLTRSREQKLDLLQDVAHST